jgi:hypothetical protein
VNRRSVLGSPFGTEEPVLSSKKTAALAAGGSSTISVEVSKERINQPATQTYVQSVALK